MHVPTNLRENPADQSALFFIFYWTEFFNDMLNLSIELPIDLGSIIFVVIK
jgi:hypothetical protein